MLSKNKTILKARLVLSIEKEDFASFRKWCEKIESFYDEYEWVEGLMGSLDVIIRRIEPKENYKKYLLILSEEVEEFYYDVFMFRFLIDSDVNESLKIMDKLIDGTERKKVKNILLKNKLNALIEYEGPDFMKDKINEEIDEVLIELDRI